MFKNMKKIKCFLIAISIGTLGLGQTPFPPLKLDNLSFTAGQHNYNSSSVKIGGTSTSFFNATGDSHVEVKATEEIKIETGFGAEPSSVGGIFSAEIVAIPFDVAIIGNTTPKLYERFEIGINPPTDILSNLANAFNDPNVVSFNPYDPDVIRFVAEFSNSNSYQRQSFYYKDFTIDVGTDIHIPSANTAYPFRIRFAPPETGTWKVKISYYLNSVLQAGEFIGHFEVTASSNPGHLVLNSPNNDYFLKFNNGTHFFGVGQSIGYVDDHCVYDARPSDYATYRSYFSDLAANSGNYARIRLNPWDFDFEIPDKIEFYTNHTKNLSWYVNNYENGQDKAWELDKVFDVAESEGIYLMMNILMDGTLIYAASPGGYVCQDIYDFNNNPYSTISGVSNIGDFFTAPSSISVFKKKLQYIIARWGYSTNLAIYQLINETDKIDGYDAGHQTLRQNIDTWQCSMANYIHQFYPWHLVTTSYSKDHELSYSPFYSYNCSDINILSTNNYGAEDKLVSNVYTQDRKMLRNRLEAVQDLCAIFPSKPFLHSEIGLSDCTQGVDACTDIEFHKGVWSSSIYSIGSAYWSDWGNLYFNHRENFRTLRPFMDLVINNSFDTHFSFERGDDATFDIFQNVKLEWFYRVNNWGSNGSYSYGWVHNRDYNWSNAPDGNTPCFNTVISSNCDNYEDFTSLGCFGGSGSHSATLKIKHLRAKKYYDYTFYVPYGSALNAIDYGSKKTNWRGLLKFKNFHLNYIVDASSGEYPDYAFIVQRSDGSNRITPSSTHIFDFDTSDTDIDTVFVNEIISLDADFSDNHNSCQFNWDFGDGNYSQAPHPVFSYSNVGTYTAHVVFYDPVLDETDSSDQIYVVIDTTGNNEGETRIRSKTLATNITIDEPSLFKVSPNPFLNGISITKPKTISRDFQVTILDLPGQIIAKEINPTYIDLEKVQVGTYLVLIEYAGKTERFKITKVN